MMTIMRQITQENTANAPRSQQHLHTCSTQAWWPAPAHTPGTEQHPPRIQAQPQQHPQRTRAWCQDMQARTRPRMDTALHQWECLECRQLLLIRMLLWLIKLEVLQRTLTRNSSCNRAWIPSRSSEFLVMTANACVSQCGGLVLCPNARACVV